MKLKDQLINGKYIIGTNYWSRCGGPHMYKDGLWDEDVVRSEFEQIGKGLGLNFVRLFMLTQDFFDGKKLNRNALEKLDKVLGYADENNIDVFLTLIVGHMSGQNYDIKHDPDFYSTKTKKVFKKFAKEVVRQYSTDTRIKGWIISNEAPLYINPTEPKWSDPYNNIEKMTNAVRFCKEISDTIKEYDLLKRPVTTGDGAFDPRYRQDQVAKYVSSIIGVHLYPGQCENLNETRQSFMLAYALKKNKAIAQLGNKDVKILAEEFGYSSYNTSEDNGAKYMRINYRMALAEGSIGVVPWCYSEQEHPLLNPYNHQTFEAGFGLTYFGGKIKKAGSELKRFKGLVEEMLKDKDIELVEHEAAIILPSRLYFQHQFSFDDRSVIEKTLLESFILTKFADMNINFLAEPIGRYFLDKDLIQKSRMFKNKEIKMKDLDPKKYGIIDIPARTKLIIVPSLQKLNAPTWYRLKEFVEDGGTLYVSYFNGVHDFHQGLWIPNSRFAEELFGVEPDMKYGLYSKIKSKSLVLKLKDKKIKINVPRDDCSTSYYSCRPLKGTKVIGTINDEPAIVEHKVGKGKVVFSLYPLEYYQSFEGHNGLDKLYGYLADISGIKRDIKADKPEIIVSELRSGDKSYVSLINTSWEDKEVKLDVRFKFKKMIDRETRKAVKKKTRIKAMDYKEILIE